MSSAHELAETAAVAMALPHSGHPGIPGAPQGVLCPRCACDRALAELERLAADAERYKAALRTVVREWNAVRTPPEDEDDEHALIVALESARAALEEAG